MEMLPAVEADPRFHSAVAQFNAGEYEAASDGFEELFFEAVRDEVEFVRAFLQVSTGLHHVERGQRRAAVERLEEGVRAITLVTNDRGFDLQALAREVRRFVPFIARGERTEWPVITKRTGF
jgi:predicted metal-dependent hydrolase